ncbi:MAG: glycosyltransferase family 39 protein, partial [Chloroflexi bacterium]|nr:glycosyltransferase family 39 protein [Chloroflexota bacterium]
MKWWILGAVALGLAVRLAVLAGPLGELDADEAVVGLMARHIAFDGERPIFYYGQAYLGSLEAFSAAPLFLLFNSSPLLLKLVPVAYSLGFLVLSALVARRLFGDGPAVLTALYLALPPAMWSVWSTKARGGYAEVLFLGEALLLIALWLASARRPIWGVLVGGLVAGLALWTHLLAVVYIVPVLVFLLLRRRDWSLADGVVAAAGGLVGAAPLLIANVAGGFATLNVVGGPSGLRAEPAGELVRFLRVGLSMLAGIGRPVPPPTTAADLALDVPTAGPLPLVVLLVVGLIGVLLWHAGSLRRLVARGPCSDAALLVLVALMVPLVLILTPYGYLMAEPRYALPLYSVVPLVANVVWRLPTLWRWGACTAVVALNVWNMFATAAVVVRPAGVVDTTPANRQVLIDYLQSHDRHQVYTDYWIAQTVMFESRESVQAAVIADGPNRYLPSADNVAQTPNAVTVLVRESETDRRFEARLAEVGATATVSTVDAYHVYAD